MPPEESRAFPRGGAPDPRRIVLLLIVVTGGLWGLRLAGPLDFLDNDQERPAAYVADILRHGRWVCPRDHTGEVASKPPLVPWVSALSTWPDARAGRFELTWPSALSTLGASLLVLGAGWRWIAPRVGVLAALFVLLSRTAFKEVGLVRTDPTFAFLVPAAALALFHAWWRGRGWRYLGLFLAGALLTKGPLALPLVFGGAVAFLLERREDRPWRPHGRVWMVLLAPVGLVVGWFALAVAAEGPEVIDKLLGKELVGHAVQDAHGRGILHAPGKPLVYFLDRFLPWSLLAAWAAWRARRFDEADPVVRRLRRFLLAALGSALLLFGIAPHQRADHILPLVPLGALLAALAAEPLIRGWSARRLERLAWGGAVLFLAIAGCVVLRVHPEKAWASRARAFESVAARAVAVEEAGGRAAFLGVPYLAQWLGGLHRRPVDAEEALALVADAEGPVHLVWDPRLAPELGEALERGGGPPLVRLPMSGLEPYRAVVSPGWSGALPPPPAPPFSARRLGLILCTAGGLCLLAATAHRWLSLPRPEPRKVAGGRSEATPPPAARRAELADRRA